MDKTSTQFPDGFLWGAATSSYQTEGGARNDWSEWEISPKRSAALKAAGLDPAEFVSGAASNSWELMEEDIKCLKQLNATAYRFSIEWSRIEPEEGIFDQAALQKYQQFIRRLKAEGIEPFVTLWHWPVPVWMRDRGTWDQGGAVSSFETYVRLVVSACPEVRFWITLNEPQIYTQKGYLAGIWPPHRKNPLAYLRVLRNLSHAHRQAYDAIKEINPQAQVGIAHPHFYFSPAPGMVNRWIAAAQDWWANRIFLNSIRRHQDFIGVNHYLHIVTKYWNVQRDSDERVSDMGWGLYPEGLYHTLMELSAYGVPLYITEHGLADKTDKYRGWYITESLRFVKRAIDEGVDVRGYLHWSLLDNFEWAHGFDKKFGLFAVDRRTWQRTARPSAALYANIARHNRLPDGTEAR